MCLKASGGSLKGSSEGCFNLRVLCGFEGLRLRAEV